MKHWKGWGVASNDIGIDLGTATVIICDAQRGIILREPAVVAVNTQTGKVLCVGEEASHMLGRTPDRIRAVMPMADGVISDFDMTSAMIRMFLQKVYDNGIVKPRVAICVPSGITEVESRAVVNAAVSAGARKVFLIEEPVAAAIGAGVDISQPAGNLILDVGGGTSDVAVLSFSGIVCKHSIKVAGQKMDQAVVRLLRQQRGVLIGQRMAERLKIEIGSVSFAPGDDLRAEAKGRNLRTGMPERLTVSRSELHGVLRELAMEIVAAVKHILEVTPPELAADIHERGMLLTGGGSLLHGFDRLLQEETGLQVHLAPQSEDCVAIGTAKAFGYLGQLYDGFVRPATHNH